MAATLTIDLVIAEPVQIATTTTTANCKQLGLLFWWHLAEQWLCNSFACFSQCPHVHESRYTHGAKASKEEKEALIR